MKAAVLRLLLLPVPAALLAAPAEAIVYVVPSDESLVDRSPVIAFGRIGAEAPGPAEAGLTTDLAFEIDDVLKGFLPGPLITVRQPGGVRADGLVGEIRGLPALIEGDRVLLLLRPDPQDDDIWRIVELGLGTFFEERQGNRVLLRRSPALEIGPRGFDEQAGRRPRRDAQRFRQWIADRAVGRNRTADYFADEIDDAPASFRSAWRLTRSPGRCRHADLPVRWREFDENREVRLTVTADRQDGVPGGGLTELRTAIGAWNDDPGSRSRLALSRSGTASGDARGDETDGVNSITYEDPHDEIPGSFPGPGRGGVLALNWVFFYCDGSRGEPHSIPGNRSVTALTLIETNITTQDGYSRWLASLDDPRRGHEEIMAHELGHALGISHACNDAASGPCGSGLEHQALMRGKVHGDGRGAALNDDDLAAVRFLYPATDDNGGADDDDRAGSCQAGDGTLCLQDGRYAVSVDWSNGRGEEGKGNMAGPRTDDSGLFWFFSEANWELLVKVLDACTSNNHHWVFAASATDVGFELTVRDTVTGRVRQYTHDAGAPARALADVTAFPDACTP